MKYFTITVTGYTVHKSCMSTKNTRGSASDTIETRCLGFAALCLPHWTAFGVVYFTDRASGSNRQRLRYFIKIVSSSSSSTGRREYCQVRERARQHQLNECNPSDTIRARGTTTLMRADVHYVHISQLHYDLWTEKKTIPGSRAEQLLFSKHKLPRISNTAKQ